MRYIFIWFYIKTYVNGSFGGQIYYDKSILHSLISLYTIKIEDSFILEK